MTTKNGEEKGGGGVFLKIILKRTRKPTWISFLRTSTVSYVGSGVGMGVWPCANGTVSL